MVRNVAPKMSATLSTNLEELSFFKELVNSEKGESSYEGLRIESYMMFPNE